MGAVESVSFSLLFWVLSLNIIPVISPLLESVRVLEFDTRR